MRKLAPALGVLAQGLNQERAQPEELHLPPDIIYKNKLQALHSLVWQPLQYKATKQEKGGRDPTSGAVHMVCGQLCMPTVCSKARYRCC
jgi:hypothetical protein